MNFHLFAYLCGENSQVCIASFFFVMFVPLLISGTFHRQNRHQNQLTCLKFTNQLRLVYMAPLP
jgi:hypothetical protein